jgi:hypothetical protein
LEEDAKDLAELFWRTPPRMDAPPEIREGISEAPPVKGAATAPRIFPILEKMLI